MNRKKRYFLITGYFGSDGCEFQQDFREYLKKILEAGRWEAMSEHQLFLQGAEQVIKEIIEELEQ